MAGSDTSIYPPFRAIAAHGLKKSNVVASITGTGNVTLKGSKINGSPMCSIQNAATTVTTNVAMITSVSGMAVAVVSVDLEAAANSIDAQAKNIAVEALVEM